MLSGREMGYPKYATREEKVPTYWTNNIVKTDDKKNTPTKQNDTELSTKAIAKNRTACQTNCQEDCHPKNQTDQIDQTVLKVMATVQQNSFTVEEMLMLLMAGHQH